MNKFKITNIFKVPISYIENNKYYLFETPKNIYVVHRSGLFNVIRKNEMLFKVSANEQFKSKSNECFSKFHYLNEEKILIMFERNSESFVLIDFKNEEKLESKKTSRFQKLKTLKIKFVQNYLLIQTIKKISLYSLPNMSLISEVQLKAKYFELATKFVRLVSYDFETNSVSVSQGEGTEMNRCASLYHTNFKKIDGLFINSEPNFRLCYFSLSEKMTNKIYVLSFDEIQKSISYLYTFHLDYFNITRMIFKPRHNLAICFDKSNKELRIYKTLNIYENRNYIVIKTNSEFKMEQHIDIKQFSENSLKKPEFSFDASTRFICQEGIYAFDYAENMVKTIFKFDPFGIRRFITFDYAPRSIDSSFACYLFTHEMDGKLSTHFLIINDKSEKIFHDETIIFSQILEIDLPKKSVQILGLLQDKKAFRTITCKYEAKSKTYKNQTVKILLDENPHSQIHSFHVHSSRKEIYILNKKTDTFELIITKYDNNSPTFLFGKLIRIRNHNSSVS